MLLLLLPQVSWAKGSKKAMSHALYEWIAVCTWFLPVSH
jgi:hypothetical protein